MLNEVAVLILAAGKGTRMKSRRAKVLHCAGGRPLIEHVLRVTLQLVPPEQCFVVVGFQAEEVSQVLQPYGVNVVEQAEQLGTGHAVLVAKKELEARYAHLLVLYGDTPLLKPETLRRLYEHHRTCGAAATILAAELADPKGYGRLIVQADGTVEAIVEELAATDEQKKIKLVNTGIYVFDNRLLWAFLEQIRPDNPAAEYYLTDVVGLLRQSGHRVHCLLAEDSTEVLGINNRIELARADRILRWRKLEELMLSGVTIYNPETVTVDPDVTIGIDTVVEEGASILGKTKIGENCHIGKGSIVCSSIIEDGVIIGPYSVVHDSVIKRQAQVGPFARLRFGNVIGERARIGNFVELKKATIGAGTNALHLAYLGDATIGESVNIGAGTITCNYDGIRKHPTQIRDRAFVGSNATLVAPLTIGEESYVGAGSTITENVPPKALALGRARQVIKPGWVDRRKERLAQQAASTSEK